MTREARRWGRSRSLAAAIGLALVCSGQACPAAVERALTAVEDAVSGLLHQIGATGWRIHIHPEVIRAGSVVAAFSPSIEGIPEDNLVCPGKCLLFFIDTKPLHHFSHPTVIALYDLEEKRMVGTLGAGWWPTIDGGSVFHTVASRRRRTTILADRGDVPPVPADPPQPVFPVGAVLMMAPARAPNTWAVIVNGYNDPSDTFDEDTLGIYRVLQGLGVAEGHIQLLSPLDHSDVGIEEIPVSVGNLETALKSVGGAGNVSLPCDDFLLFISTHGDPLGNLACGTDPNHAAGSATAGGFQLLRKDLKRMLVDHVHQCENVTIVIEACKSGGVLDFLECTNEPAGSGCTAFRSAAGDGEWQMFASAAAGMDSAGDVDTAADLNLADSGSETVWGYVEAFATRDADTDGNGWVDFSEAVAYAIAKDATASSHSPATRFSSISTGQGVHGSDKVTWGGAVAVTIEELCTASQASASAACSNDVIRCCDAELTVEVENTAQQPVERPVALRLFVRDPASSGTPHYTEDLNMHATMILPGLGPLKTAGYDISLGEIPAQLSHGHTIPMQAVVDHLVQQQTAPLQTQPPYLGATDDLTLTVRRSFLNVCCWLSSSLCPQ